MDKLFFDTSSLLMLAKEDIEKYAPIIISSISLKELENIKSSNHKSDEIKPSNSPVMVNAKPKAAPLWTNSIC